MLFLYFVMFYYGFDYTVAYGLLVKRMYVVPLSEVTVWHKVGIVGGLGRFSLIAAHFSPCRTSAAVVFMQEVGQLHYVERHVAVIEIGAPRVAPTPFTMYPFFNLSISISCFITISLSLSTSVKDLLV